MESFDHVRLSELFPVNFGPLDENLSRSENTPPQKPGFREEGYLDPKSHLTQIDVGKMGTKKHFLRLLRHFETTFSIFEMFFSLSTPFTKVRKMADFEAQSEKI